ncbi:uncharacterized protein LOC143224648 isoform X2 [Tachypleus tridentatus]|uniref:uncharacterized protein LOC143224648 isoform X2 n=1 Tax=Tachypleus tridentatus TaxID=6853 RepID=UPI003FD05166
MMENAYGIGVKNRYDIFLNEDEDPLEILKQQEEKKEKKKTDKVSKEPKVKSVKIGKQNVIPPAPKKGGKEDVNNVRTQELQQKRSERPPPRISGDKTRFIPHDDHKENEERKNRRNKEAPFPQVDGRDCGDGEFGMRRGRGGGRGRGRGGRGRGIGIDGRGKREFDRQSGSDKSGVKPVDKKEGGGAHNWGTMKDELDMQFNMSKDEVPEMDRSADIAQETTELKEGEGEAVGDEGKISADDEPKEMTLDEWKQQQEEMRSVPKFNLRKPGEGENQTQTGKKLYILKKKEEEEDEIEDEEESEDEDELSRRGRQKHVVDIEINFSDSRRGRGRGRGGMRGSGIRGGRGGGSIGSGRGLPKATKSSRQAAPKVDDLEDFPSLATA